MVMNVRKDDIVNWLSEEYAIDREWEEAYGRFESREQETRKFLRRLHVLGATAWPKDSRIVELFCGRCSGLKALDILGFSKLEGVDISYSLLETYQGLARLYAGDCRSLRFPDCSKDIVIVQGGLHHLEQFPSDLESVLRQVHRILIPGGKFVCVEPWLTPFLKVVHVVCRNRLMRLISGRLDALQAMIECEQQTYMQWLEGGKKILDIMNRYFVTDDCNARMGKIMFVGRPRL
jgi:SAM-dependent methyltransferase